jgi:hypothetical protein
MALRDPSTERAVAAWEVLERDVWGEGPVWVQVCVAGSWRQPSARLCGPPPSSAWLAKEACCSPARYCFFDVAICPLGLID